MGYGGLPGIVHTLNTANEIAINIEGDATYSQSDLENNPARINEKIKLTLSRLGIRGRHARQIQAEVIRKLQHADGIPDHVEWIANITRQEM